MAIAALSEQGSSNLQANDSDRKVLGDQTFRAIDWELVVTGYPPAKQEKAMLTVLEHARRLCRGLDDLKGRREVVPPPVLLTFPCLHEARALRYTIRSCASHCRLTESSFPPCVFFNVASVLAEIDAVLVPYDRMESTRRPA